MPRPNLLTSNTSFSAPRLPARAARVAICVMAFSSVGCAANHNYGVCDRPCVRASVAERFGHEMGPATCPFEIVYPHGISLDDELTEERAVLLALWNNASFLESLADLGMARGDLVQAGLLPNPEVIYFWPVDGKPFKYLLDFPIEALWLRPIRVAAAERENERVCQRLSQLGLDLIRDVRQSHADALLALARRQITREALQIRVRIAELAEARLQAGDISPQEASTARIDADRARQDAVRAEYDVALVEERLRNLMGVSDNPAPLRLSLEAAPVITLGEIDPLLDEATGNRPDVLAAELNAEAAAERLRLSRLSWFRLLGALDATSGRNGHEFGPAARMTLPIFHWNQGNILRAEAELEKAERQRMTIHNQVILDVRQAYLRLSQGQAELKVLTEKVRPEAEVAIRRTETAYQAGNTPYVVVLQTTQQLIDSRLREAQLHADLRRAWAELERSVGRHLDDDAARRVVGAPSLIEDAAVPSVVRPHVGSDQS